MFAIIGHSVLHDSIQLFNDQNCTVSIIYRVIFSGEKDSQPQQPSVKPTRLPATAILPSRPPLVHDVSQSQSESDPAQTVPETLQSSPSNCVWAIISCCSATSITPPQNCFEQRGCPGPFWGNSPCHSDFARTAIAAAVEYYNRHPTA